MNEALSRNLLSFQAADGEVKPTKEVKDEPSDKTSETGNDSKEAASADVKSETSDAKMESSEETEMVWHSITILNFLFLNIVRSDNGSLNRVGP